MLSESMANAERLQVKPIDNLCLNIPIKDSQFLLALAPVETVLMHDKQQKAIDSASTGHCQ